MKTGTSSPGSARSQAAHSDPAEGTHSEPRAKTVQTGSETGTNCVEEATCAFIEANLLFFNDLHNYTMADCYQRQHGFKCDVPVKLH